MAWGQALVIASLGAVSACGIGIRAGGGVSHARPTADTTDEFSASQSWLETEGVVSLSHLRVMAFLGGGNDHVRFRSGDMVGALDDTAFLPRVGGGLGVALVHVGPILPVPYALASDNFSLMGTPGLATTYELGVDLEVQGEDTSKLGKLAGKGLGGSGLLYTGVIGVAITREHLVTGDSSSADTTGLMVTIGFRLAGKPK